MFAFLCKTVGLKLGCTWVVKTEDPSVRWNTTEGQGQLEMTETQAEAAPRQWLECTVCGKRDEQPTPDKVKSLVG